MIRNLLLDLGGILYGVDYYRTTRALGLPDAALPDLLQDPILAAYEKGVISTADFLAHWQSRFPHLSLEVLTQAWNAMLLGPLPEAEAVLETLHLHFSLAIFSNTNDLHLTVVEPQLCGWKRYFQYIFFSNRIHRRKPEPEAFMYVLSELRWALEETLFVDDSAVNVTGAQAAGIKAILFHPPNQPLHLLTLLRQEKALS